ncbi:MAG: LacI family DNA-binding transcriptional regulator [Paracoccus sp. (in: a-proteobacteria)]
MTLHDVAREAGVSKSSVSRMLDERLPKSDSETAQRVRRIAREMGYVRDVAAASLRRGSTGMIGVIVPRLTDTVMAMLYEALAHAAARAGQFAIVATTDDDPDADRRAAEALLQRGVDGLILSTAREGSSFTRDLTERGVRHVLAMRHEGDSLAAVGDDRLGGYLATRHLIDLGHREIALLTGPDYASSARGRAEGYRQAMTEADLPIRPDLQAPSSFSIESGAEAVTYLLDLDRPPTAVFAVNDNTAIGALSALTRRGISVPSDISLVGYNDIPIVSRLPTPLTTVRVPFDQVAMAALDLFLADEPPVNERIRIMAPTLIPRQSTARIT